MLFLKAAPVFNLLTLDFNTVKKFPEFRWIVRILECREEFIVVTTSYLLVSVHKEHLSLRHVVLSVPTQVLVEI